MEKRASPRIVAPDVARGLALFGIAWANIATGWAAASGNPPAEGFGGVTHAGVLGLLDQIAVVGSAMFAHVRGLPMFSTLLGFGVGLLTMSLWRRAYPPGAAQRVLGRRYGWLAVIGVVHCVLLFFGDIILLYSLLALILVLMIRLKDRTLLIIAGVLFSLHVAGSLAITVVTPPELAVSGGLSPPETYLGYLGFNLTFVFGYVVSVPIAGLSILPLLIVGFVAARRGVHLHPEKFLRALWAWVIITAVIIIGVGLPWGLAAIGVLPESWEFYLAGINSAVGYLTGPGIAAAVLLACRGLQRRVQAAHDNGEAAVTWPLPLAMVIALGKRSMSGYILQSMLFFVICLPFTLDLGSEAGAAGQFLIAFGVWAVTVLAAWLQERAGLRGPVEVLHRRLSYGKEGRLPERFSPRGTDQPNEPARLDPAQAPPGRPQH